MAQPTRSPPSEGGRSLARPRAEPVVLALVGLAIAIAPLGHLSAQPLLFILYRTLLFGAIGVGLWTARATSGPGLPVGLPTRIYGLIAGTLVLMLVSLWLNPASLGHGYLDWSEHVLLALFLIVLVRFAGRRTLRWKSSLLALVIVIPAGHLVYGLAGATGAVSGSFANPNHFASYLLVGFGAALGVAIFHTNLRWRLTAGAAGLFLGYGILETVSRGATLAALAVLLAGLWKLKPRLVLVGVAVLAVAMPFWIVFWNPPVVQKFLDSGEQDPYNYSRAEIWASTATMIAERPLMGVGLSQYEHAARKYRFPVDNTIGRFMKRQAIAHSEYLHYAAETGIPATLLLLGLIGYFFRRLMRARHGIGPEAVFLERAALLIIVGVSVHAGVDNNFQTAIVLSAMSVVALASAPSVEARNLRPATSLRGAASARFSHQWFAAAPDTSASTALRSVGLLDVLFKYASVALPSLALSWRRLRRFATTTGEKSGLVGAAVVLLYIQSSLVPAIAYQLNAVGHRAYVDGRLEQAARAHRLAVGFRPADPVLLANLGVVYKEQFLREGDPHLLDIAEAYFLRAADSNPAFYPARLEHLYSVMFRLTDNDGRNEAVHRQIASTAGRILEIDPYVVAVRRNRAEALFQGGDVSGAMEELRTAVTMEPNFVPAHLKLAELYDINGDIERRDEHLALADAIRERYAGAEGLTDYEIIILGIEGAR